MATGVPSENHIVRRMLALAKRLFGGRYAWWVRIHGSPYGQRGTPDLLFCVRGRFVGVEVKNPRGRVSALQQGALKRIAHAGGIAAVLCSHQQLRELIERIVKADDECAFKKCGCPCHQGSEVVYEREQFAKEVARTVGTPREEEIPLGRIGRDEVEL